MFSLYNSFSYTQILLVINHLILFLKIQLGFLACKVDSPPFRPSNFHFSFFCWFFSFLLNLCLLGKGKWFLLLFLLSPSLIALNYLFWYLPMCTNFTFFITAHLVFEKRNPSKRYLNMLPSQPMVYK